MSTLYELFKFSLHLHSNCCRWICIGLFPPADHSVQAPALWRFLFMFYTAVNRTSRQIILLNFCTGTTFCTSSSRRHGKGPLSVLFLLSVLQIKRTIASSHSTLASRYFCVCCQPQEYFNCHSRLL